MKPLVKLLIPLLSLFIGLNVKATSITFDSDTISENTVWDADTVYVVYCIVDSGATLTIAPGTVILFPRGFAEYGGITVYGSLNAEGTHDKRIKFTLADTITYLKPGYEFGGFGWKGITFKGTKDRNAYSVMKYCDVMYTGCKFPKARSGDGAVVAENYNYLIIENCVFRDNYSYDWFSYHGYVFSAGAITVTNSKTEITGNIITGTSTGILIKGNERCIVINNYISNWNYGIVTQSDLTLIGNLITGSRMAIGILSDETLYVHSINNTLANNTQKGFYCDAQNATLNIINTILMNNTSNSAIHIKACDTINISHSLIENGEENIIIEDTSAVFTSIDNLQVAPNFMDLYNGNFNLLPNSAAVNSGTCDTTGLGIPKLDIAGNPRIFEGQIERIDIGAFEFQNDQSNIKPFLKETKDQHLLPGESVLMQVDFLDVDENDVHTISIHSGDRHVEIINLSGDTTGSTYEIHAKTNWQGISPIFMTIEDSYGNIAKDSFNVYVSVAPCGILSHDEVWSTDTVRIYCDLIIDDSCTLEIEPSTVVEFYGPYVLEIRGCLKAMGTQNDSIIFSIPKCNINKGFSKNWGGIRFNVSNRHNEHSKLTYCIIEYAMSSLMNLDGGGVSIEESVIPEIDHCIIQNNKALRDGGGLYVRSNEHVKITNSIFYNNQADRSGGGLEIDLETGSCTLVNSIIKDNHASEDGGGLSSENGVIILINNIFVNNSAGSIGGGCFFGYKSNVKIINNSLVNNRAQNYSAIYCVQISNLDCINSILWGNKDQSGYQVYQEDWLDGYLNFDHSNIEGKETSVYSEFPSKLFFQNIYNTDPYFIDDSIYGCMLSDSSSMINTGTPDTTGLNLPLFDVAGNPRILDFRIDIGAYEFSPNFNILLQPVGDSMCQGSDFSLTTKAFGGVMGYQWQKDGNDIANEADTILHFGAVNNTHTGKYYCKIITSDGIKSTDTVQVLVHPLPVVSLGKDTTINKGDVTELDAGEGYTSYFWNTGAETQVLPVNQSQIGNNEYWVTVVDSNSCSSGDTIVITVVLQDAVSDYTNTVAVKVYPNPASTHLLIEFTNEMREEVIIELRSLTGLVLMSSKIRAMKAGDRITWDIPELGNGLYFITLNNGSYSTTQKIEIIR